MGSRKKIAPLDNDDDSDVSDAPTQNLDKVDDKLSVLKGGRPPPLIFFEEFRDRFCLNAKDLNLKKSKQDKDIT